jgi:hypothetical protein
MVWLKIIFNNEKEHAIPTVSKYTQLTQDSRKILTKLFCRHLTSSNIRLQTTYNQLEIGNSSQHKMIRNFLVKRKLI